MAGQVRWCSEVTAAALQAVDSDVAAIDAAVERLLRRRAARLGGPVCLLVTEVWALPLKPELRAHGYADGRKGRGAGHARRQLRAFGRSESLAIRVTGHLSHC